MRRRCPRRRERRRRRRRRGAGSTCCSTGWRVCSPTATRQRCRSCASPERRSLPTGPQLKNCVGGGRDVVSVHLWDDEGWDTLSERHVRLARETGALADLQLALSQRISMHLFDGTCRRQRRSSRNSRPRPKPLAAPRSLRQGRLFALRVARLRPPRSSMAVAPR